MKYALLLMVLVMLSTTALASKKGKSGVTCTPGSPQCHDK